MSRQAFPARLALGVLVAIAALIALGVWLHHGRGSRAPSPPKGAPPPLVIEPGVITYWNGSDDGDPAYYQVGDLLLTLAAKTAPEGELSMAAAIPTITIAAARLEPATFDGVEGFSDVQARFGAGEIDPAAPGPEVVLLSYSGGAHCCTDFQVIERSGEGWTAIDLGEFDGEGVEDWPSDLNGDGAPEFRFSDDRFLYAFGSYAASKPPPKFMAVRGGQIVDLTSENAFDPEFEKFAEATKLYCADGEKASCASYTAAMARLGRLDEAWSFMRTHYRNDDFDYPTVCRSEPTPDGLCARGETVQPKSYPEALAWFLFNTGYITDAQREALTKKR